MINQIQASMDATQPVRRVQRVRHELRRRELQVVQAERLSPGFVSVTFAGESLADFASDSFDDHVKLLFPAAGGETIGRDYTPRAFDRARQRLTIEFAMHGDGVADRWAREARGV
jgi:NADPH-dependent ferric siderophore reductase